MENNAFSIKCIKERIYYVRCVAYRVALRAKTARGEMIRQLFHSFYRLTTQIDQMDKIKTTNNRLFIFKQTCTILHP